MVQVGALAQNIDTLIGAAIVTPGVTSPLTNAQIARAYPQDALTGAAVDKPVLLKSKGGMSVRVVKLADGLSHPDGLVFLPGGDSMLVTERPGRLRLIKGGVLDPTPVTGLPEINNVGLGGCTISFCIPTLQTTSFYTFPIRRSGNHRKKRRLRSCVPALIGAG